MGGIGIGSIELAHAHHHPSSNKVSTHVAKSANAMPAIHPDRSTHLKITTYIQSNVTGTAARLPGSRGTCDDNGNDNPPLRPSSSCSTPSAPPAACRLPHRRIPSSPRRLILHPPPCLVGPLRSSRGGRDGRSVSQPLPSSLVRACVRACVPAQVDRSEGEHRALLSSIYTKMIDRGFTRTNSHTALAAVSASASSSSPMFVARNALRLAGGSTPTSSASSSLLFIKHAPFPGAAATRRRFASGALRCGWTVYGVDGVDVDKYDTRPLVLLPPEIRWGGSVEGLSQSAQSDRAEWARARGSDQWVHGDRSAVKYCRSLTYASSHRPSARARWGFHPRRPIYKPSWMFRVKGHGSRKDRA